MQLLTLEFEGIGPFTGRHHVDFRALGEGGLFLLEGPTGSGKTTIIDAIVFALYGDVAGVDSSKGRLVSTQLPIGVEPYVEATFETSRGLLRVRRVPQHERRKSRGAGTTVGKASIKLWRLTHPADEGVLLSTSFSEASEEMQRAIGLTKEQFTQTVVLPQGHFATFLRAKPEERRGVLQDIFGTEFYERVARRLTELASGYRTRDADARAALQRAGSGFALVGWGPDAPERGAFEASVRDDPESGAALAAARAEALAQRAAELGVAACEADEVAARAEEAARAVVERNAAIEEFGRLTVRLEALKAAGEAVARAEATLSAAERAEHVRHPLDAVARARQALEGANADAARAVAALAEGPDSDLAGLGPEGLDAALLEASGGRSALQNLVELEGGLANRADQLTIERARLGSRRSDVRLERERVEADRSRAEELAPRFDELMAVAETRVACAEAEVLAKTQCDQVRRLEFVASEFVQARAVEALAGDEAEVAAAAHAHARSAWLGGLAGTLAGELTAGQACPVCGSKRHPAPASLPEGAVDRATVEALDAAARTAGEAHAAAQARSDSLATAMADQQAVVGDLTRIEAELALAEASEHKRVAELAAAEASSVRGRIQALMTGADERERGLHATEQQLATDEGNLGARAERLDADRQRVAEQLGGWRSIAERASGLGRRADRARRLAAHLRQSGDAGNGLAEREGELAAALAEQGFTDAAAARAALLEASERGRLTEAVATHRQKLASVVERLGDERLAGLAGQPVVDETPTRSAAQAARAARDAARAALGSAETDARLAAEASAELSSCVAELALVRAEAEPYLRMADLAQASLGNRKSVTLPTFVLLERFEEVVDLANARLDAMTGGRYALRRTDSREGRSQKLGLGLEVVDHASADAARDPKTLSGGETFQAALAMALGLADAVTSEAGGVELNTLFVDEGFGSLDPEALDMVMDQLTALRDGGRSVGVVSHVAEMKQRIAERITVVPRRDGTSTLTTSLDSQPALAG